MENSWPYIPAPKPHLQIRNDIHSQNVFIQRLFCWRAWITGFAAHWNMTCALRWQAAWGHSWYTPACSGPFLEATAATSRLSHHLVRALEVCGEVGGFLRLVKDVMVTVLLKGESLKVRFGGEWPGRKKWKAQIGGDFAFKLCFPATSQFLKYEVFFLIG